MKILSLLAIVANDDGRRGIVDVGCQLPQKGKYFD